PLVGQGERNRRTRRVATLTTGPRRPQIRTKARRLEKLSYGTFVHYSHSRFPRADACVGPVRATILTRPAPARREQPPRQPTTTMSPPTPEQQLALYRQMVRIRRCEEALVKEHQRGLIPGACHTYVGQEAVAAGVCAHLRRDDVVFSTHRG